MTLKIIHVNRQNIAMNGKDGKNRPQIIVREKGQKVKYVQDVHIDGPCTLVGTKGQLSCGAKVWIETDAPITLTGETDFKGSRDGY